MGGPWICAATVRAVSHVSALTVMSTDHAPGEPPRIVGVKDQRLSFLFVSIILGIGPFLGPVLKIVPGKKKNQYYQKGCNKIIYLLFWL